MRVTDHGVSRRETALVVAATLACLLPFLDRAFDLDDPFYLWLARQIQAAPLDFFGFSVNWSGTELPVAAENKNPPLVAFYIAAAAGLAGWSEPALHAAFLLPALGVTLATLALARRLDADPLLAALACLTLPVFLVSATTLMTDVPMLALWCLALLCWMRGLEERRPPWLLAGALLSTLAVLTKYFGLALLPLLALWSRARERRAGVWLPYLAIPLAGVGAYELYTAQVYGSGLLGRAAGYALATRPGELGALERLAIGWIFAGGVLAPVLGFAPALFSRRMLLASAALTAAALALFGVWGRFGPFPLRGPEGLDLNLLGHLAIFAAAAACVASLVGADLARGRDADAWLLALWVAGGFGFAACVNYTTNARALLPLAPPVAILLARRARGLGRARRYAPLLPAALLTLAVTWADAERAGAGRRAAGHVAATHVEGPGTRWFEGHWGFQLYLERAGWRPVDLRRSVLRPGDLLASPLSWKRRLGIPAGAATRIDAFQIPAPAIATMAPEAGAGLHAIQWGPLPYRLQPGRAERFEVRRLDEVILFETDPVVTRSRGLELERAEAWLAALASDIGECQPLEEALAACGWCATREECADCLGAELERRAAPPSCVDRLERVRPGR